MDNDEARIRERLCGAVEHVEREQAQRAAAGVSDGEYRVLITCDNCQKQFRLPGNEIMAKVGGDAIYLGVDARLKTCKCPHCWKQYYVVWAMHVTQIRDMKIDLGIPGTAALGCDGKVTSAGPPLR